MPDVVLAAVPTSFAADGSLDHAGALRLLEFLAARVDGMLVAGTTGEFPALDPDERLFLIETALEVAGPDRVIAHIGAPDAYHATRLAREAALLGATRIAAITPYYAAPTPTEVTSYYARIREAAPLAELYAYIFPERTGLTVAPQQVCELADDVGLAGAKFSGVAALNVAECAAARPALRIFSGDDSDLAATLRVGGAGIISARTSAYPEVFSALSAALATPGAEGEAAARQADVSAIVALGASVGLVKQALRLRGFGPMTARMPASEPDEAAAAR
ncbi:MAG TPA: dihydrodipicolinate synthase family protein, partial [Trebonia sp.]|nr:dihydrodipicolinate synthase family protein [Trebonia sp.]